jgi:alcohol dehydrogenase (quinone), cytochrome c subunit
MKAIKGDINRVSLVGALFLLLLLSAAARGATGESITDAQRTDLANAFYARPAGAVNTAQPIISPALIGASQANNPQLLRGQYLAQMGSCLACHTRPGGIPFAGGLPLKTPFGTIISTNITPDKEQGIGNDSLAQFEAALRRGIGKQGHNLYPAMPYTHYALMSSQDIADLFAYFLQVVPAAKQDNPQTDLSWPFSMRWLLKAWNLLYLPSPGFEQNPLQTGDWNRGAYLVQGPMHCSACHTPRNALGGEVATSEKQGKRFLSGALIDGWYAQPLSTPPARQGALDLDTGLRRWSESDIVEYLRTGRSKRSAAFGAMSEVVMHNTQYLSPLDAHSVAVYLKSLTLSEPQSIGTAMDGTLPEANPHPSTIALRADNVDRRGALLYLNNCSGCHRTDGEGVTRTFPALALSSSVNAADTTSLIRIVLHGSSMPATLLAPSALAMPGLGWRMNDEDLASVLSFVRSSWGNQSASVSATQVATVRAATAEIGAK